MANESESELTHLATFPRMRALAWSGSKLYASRGYTLVSLQLGSGSVEWRKVAAYRPAWWRKFTASIPLTFRLVRDGFHALAVLSSGHLIAAVPGAIVRLCPGQSEFAIAHKILRGTRPLHIAVTPNDQIFWGEYFDNPDRDEVHIYSSSDQGATWNVAYTFPKGAIRHVHNIVYDKWKNCLWILTGDNGAECRILRASPDLRSVDVILSGNQQARAVALVPDEQGVYFSSDTPFETNHVYYLDRQGNVSERTTLSGSSIYGCAVGDSIFFSTMVEPSTVNPDRHVNLYASRAGQSWQQVMQWEKDRWPMGLFQYGNAMLPDGDNTTSILAVSTIAVDGANHLASFWKITL